MDERTQQLRSIFRISL